MSRPSPNDTRLIMPELVFGIGLTSSTLRVLHCRLVLGCYRQKARWQSAQNGRPAAERARSRIARRRAGDPALNRPDVVIYGTFGPCVRGAVVLIWWPEGSDVMNTTVGEVMTCQVMAAREEA